MLNNCQLVFQPKINIFFLVKGLTYSSRNSWKMVEDKRGFKKYNLEW